MPRVALGFRDAVVWVFRAAAGFDLRAAPDRVGQPARDFVLAVRDVVLRLTLLFIWRVLVAFVAGLRPVDLAAWELRAAFGRERVELLGFGLAAVLRCALLLEQRWVVLRLDELLRALGELRRVVLRIGISLSPMFGRDRSDTRCSFSHVLNALIGATGAPLELQEAKHGLFFGLMRRRS